MSHLLPRFDVLSVNRLICRVSLDVRLTNAGRAFVLAILATSYSVVCLPSIGNSSCEWFGSSHRSGYREFSSLHDQLLNREPS